jgi:hypothetical protein
MLSPLWVLRRGYGSRHEHVHRERQGYTLPPLQVNTKALAASLLSGVLEVLEVLEVVWHLQCPPVKS